MNNIDEMPARCKACPYWEACEYPYICQDTEPKPAENGNLNAGIAENLQNRPTDGDLISKQAALDAVNIADDNGQILTILDVLDVIKALPPVQPKHGKWLPDNRCGGGYWVCSSCKHPTEAFAADVLYKYCPFCGADMRCSENPNS